jgi:hypothetical protein
MAKARASKISSTTTGIRLTVGMVVLSWTGLQCVFLGGALEFRKQVEGLVWMEVTAVVLVAYSVYLRVRMKRHDTVPYREQAQLFYLGFLVFLVPVTLWLWRAVYHKLFVLGAVGWAPSILISAVYFLMILVHLNSDVDTYPRAPRDAWSRRLMRVIKAPLEWFKSKET